LIGRQNIILRAGAHGRSESRKRDQDRNSDAAC
jgi:hypothetical protein